MWLYFLPNDHPIFVNSKVQRSPLWLGGHQRQPCIMRVSDAFQDRCGHDWHLCKRPFAFGHSWKRQNIVHWCKSNQLHYIFCPVCTLQLQSVHMISKLLKTCRNSLQHLLSNVLRCVCFYVQKCHTQKWFCFSEYLQLKKLYK